MNCALCLRQITSHHRCRACEAWMCGKCFDDDRKLCVRCAEERKAE